MSENNQNNENKCTEDLKKALKVGVGAILGAVEKTVNYAQEVTTEGTEANKRASRILDDMAQKGDEMLHRGAALGSEIKDKVVSAVNSIPVGFDNIVSTLETLSGEELTSLRDEIDAILTAREEQKDAPCEEEPANAQAEDGESVQDEEQK